MAFLQNNGASREPFLNAPPVVLWLIGFLLAAHIVRIVLPGYWSDEIIAEFGFTPAFYAQATAQGLPQSGVLGLVLPFVTYMLLHGDFTHVGLNCLWLLVFGPIVCRRLRNLSFLMFFVFCGVVAALIHLVIYWGSPMGVVGASGAISGLMGAGMRILYGRIQGSRSGLAPIFSRPILAFSLVWAIVNVITGVLRIGVSDDLTLVAWVAHLGGYLAGLSAIGQFGRGRATA